MKRTKKELHESTEVKDKEYNCLILLNKESEINLKVKTGSLTAYDTISKKSISIKFSKKSKLYSLLSGYMMLKENYKSSRLIAIEVDSKMNAVVLEDKKLKAIEKKYLSKQPWYLVHKNSFGIGA